MKMVRKSNQFQFEYNNIIKMVKDLGGRKMDDRKKLIFVHSIFHNKKTA